MLSIYDQIQELRAELTLCILTPQEREEARAQLDRLLAEQTALDRDFDRALEALAPTWPPG